VQGERRCGAGVDDEPGGGGEGVQVGEVVLVELGQVCRAREWASSGEQEKSTLFLAFAEIASTVSRGNWARSW
jgi:hypothetical protein